MVLVQIPVQSLKECDLELIYLALVEVVIIWSYLQLILIVSFFSCSILRLLIYHFTTGFEVQLFAQVWVKL